MFLDDAARQGELFQLFQADLAGLYRAPKRAGPD
jgi:hypothetical protein